MLPVQIGDASLTLAYCQRPGTGPPVLLLHGMGASRLTFWPWMQRTRVKNSLWALDLPGFGASSLPRRRQTLSDLVAAAWAFAETVAPGRRWIWVGHSMGGMVAGELAIVHREASRGVIFIAAAGLIAPENTFTPTPWVWVNRLGIWWTSTAWVGSRILRGLGVDPARLAPEDRARLRYGWRAAREMARMGAFYEAPRLWERLLATGVPVEAIWGDRDVIFPLEKVRARVGAALAVAVMPGAGHLPMDSDPACFDNLLTQAIERLSREGSD